MTTTTTEDAKSLLQTIVSYPSLIPFEEDLALDPYNVSKWCRYIEEIDNLLLEEPNAITPEIRVFVSQRSVTLLPGSYKLWRLHLQFLKQCVYNKKSHLHHHDDDNASSVLLTSSQKQFQLVSDAYESCLIRLHKAPRIWLEYMEWELCFETNITKMRHLINRALQALPLSQHSIIWEFVLENIVMKNKHGSAAVLSQFQKIPTETRLQLYKRACMLDPSKRQGFAQLCMEFKQYDLAGKLYMELVNDTDFVSPQGTTRHDLWMTFCNIMTTQQHPSSSSSTIDFDAIVRAALPKPQEQQNNNKNTMDRQSPDNNSTTTDAVTTMNLKEMEGTLWTKLATYHVRQGNFEMARSVYEEALERVVKVRDFSIVFDAYVQMEEQMVEAMMELENDEEDDEEESNNNNADDWDILLGDAAASSSGNNTMADMELALARAEHLTTVRRPLLLNRVLLRQNPHNVGEWLKRADLYLEQKDTLAAAGALEEALTTVQAKYAVNGSPYEIVLKLTQQVYKDNPIKAKSVYRRICDDLEYSFSRVEDLAQCYCAYCEFELSQEAWDDALSIVRRGTTKVSDPNQPRVVRNLYKSLQLWDLLLDLEESLGTVQTTKDAYNRAMDLKVATPMHVMNFCDFLKDQTYFEESFAAYERGIELFGFPHDSAKILWTKYLEAFLERYKDGNKMERIRDLFSRCLENCPPELSSDFFMMQGELEEKHGLTKRALGVYQTMCDTVPPAEKQTAYKLLIAKTQKYLGVPATRDVYQNAIATLEDRPAAEMCLDFAKTETLLHEMDRARALYKYGAQLADPRRHAEYWQQWHEFEVAHGNEETFRDMLRVKRSVQAAFSTVNYNAAEMGGGDAAAAADGEQEPLTDEQAMSMIADREGVSIPTQQQPRVGGFVKAKRTAELAELGEVENRVAKLRKATAGVDVKTTTEDETRNDGDDDDEIDLDDDDLEEEEPHVESSATDGVKEVTTKAVPAAVFGGLKADDAAEKPKMGALERLRAAAAANKGGE